MEKHEECFEFSEESDILKVTRISTFFKMLEKQKHDFGVKLNTIRESISYSREEMKALFSNILEETD